MYSKLTSFIEWQAIYAAICSCSFVDFPMATDQGPGMGKCSPGASRKVPPPQSKSVPPHATDSSKVSLSGRNYFITMHHQAGSNFENFTQVKFRDILLIGTGHRDRRLNRDNPGQTGTYGRSRVARLIDLILAITFYLLVW